MLFLCVCFTGQVCCKREQKTKRLVYLTQKFIRPVDRSKQMRILMYLDGSGSSNQSNKNVIVMTSQARDSRTGRESDYQRKCPS